MAICAILFSATSCLENVEPAGIENLRNAKAELIKAEAAYKTAEIQLLNAQIAYQEAINQGAALENELKEVEIAQKELELQIEKDQHEYNKKLQELELARLEQENEYQISLLEQEIADLEIRILNREIEILALQQQKELMIEQHNIQLVGLKEQLALAEANLAMTLRDIEAAAAGLSPEEKTTIDDYINKINNVRQELAQGEMYILEAQQNLLEAKFDFDSAGKVIQYQLEIDNAQKTLDDYNEELAFAQSIDLNAEIATHQKSIEDIDEQITAIDERIFEIDQEYLGQTEELAPYNDSIAALDARDGEIDDEIIRLQAEANNLRNELLADYVTITLPISSDEIAHLAAISGLYLIEDATDGTVQVDNPFVHVPFASMYTVPSGKFSWTASNYFNLYGDGWFNGLEDVLDELRSYQANGMDLIQYQDYLDQYTEAYKETQEAFTANSAKLKLAVEDYIANYDLYTAEENQKILKDAIDKLTAFSLLGSPTDEQKLQIVKDIRTVVPVLKYRIALDNYHNDALIQSAIITYTEAELQNAIFGTTPTLTITDVRYEINRTYNSNVYEYTALIPNNPYSATFIASAADAEDKDKSAMQRWNEASKANYDSYNATVEYTDPRYELTPEFISYGIDWFYDFSITTPSGNSFAPVKKNYNTTLSSIADIFGYSSTFYYSPDNYGFLKPIINKERVNVYTAVIGFQDELAELIATLEAEVKKLNDIDASVQAGQLEFYKQIKALNEEKLEIIDKKEAINDQIAIVNAKYTALNDEESRLNSKKSDLNSLRGIIVSYVEAILDNVTDNNVTAYDTFEEDYEAWIEGIKTDIVDAEADLRDAERNLEKLVAGLYDEQQAIKEAELELELMMEFYNELLEEFNMWSELLKEFLALITA